MKKSTKTIYPTVIILILACFDVQAQTYKAQTWLESCWAAATENVFYRTFSDTTKNVKECTLVRWKSCYMPCSSGATCGSVSVSGRYEYANIAHLYASFSYIKDGSHTLCWATLQGLKKPIIFSFDSDVLNLSHFVNIYGVKQICNSSKWLYVFDTFPTLTGTHYLKNYLSYQLPTVNPRKDSLQTTYYNFGKNINGIYHTRTIYKTFIQTGIPSNPNVYTNYSAAWVNAQFRTVFNGIKSDSNAATLTGITRAILRDSIVMGLPVITVENYKRQVLSSGSTVVVSSVSRSQVVPVFETKAGKLKSISLIVLLRKTANSNMVVIDKIQPLNLPENVIAQLGLPKSGMVNGVRQVLIQGIEFINTEGGGLYIKKIEENIYYDVLKQNGLWLPETEFHKLVINDKTMTIGRPIDFSKDLRTQGFDIRQIGGIDHIIINNQSIKVSDFKQQIQSLPNLDRAKKVVVFEKNQ